MQINIPDELYAELQANHDGWQSAEEMIIQILREYSFNIERDALTGCQNRWKFEHDLHEHIEQNRGKVEEIEETFLCLNTKNHRQYNSDYGHAFGDLVTVYVMLELLREFPFHTVYRVGGDLIVVWFKQKLSKETPPLDPKYPVKMAKLNVVVNLSEQDTTRIIREGVLRELVDRLYESGSE